QAELRRGAATKPGRSEERVVTEAAVASESLDDAPRELSSRRRTTLGTIFARHREHQHRDETRRPLRFADAPKALEEQYIVLCVRRRLSSEARRVNARRASQRIHLEAAVLSERGEARRFTHRERLQPRIFFEGRAGLFDAEIRRHAPLERDELNPRIAQQEAQFTHLPFICGA